MGAGTSAKPHIGGEDLCALLADLVEKAIVEAAPAVSRTLAVRVAQLIGVPDASSPSSWSGCADKLSSTMPQTSQLMGGTASQPMAMQNTISCPQAANSYTVKSLEQLVTDTFLQSSGFGIPAPPPESRSSSKGNSNWFRRHSFDVQDLHSVFPGEHKKACRKGHEGPFSKACDLLTFTAVGVNPRRPDALQATYHDPPSLAPTCEVQAPEPTSLLSDGVGEAPGLAHCDSEHRTPERRPTGEGSRLTRSASGLADRRRQPTVTVASAADSESTIRCRSSDSLPQMPGFVQMQEMLRQQESMSSLGSQSATRRGSTGSARRDRQLGHKHSLLKSEASFTRQTSPGALERRLTVNQVMTECIDDLAREVSFAPSVVSRRRLCHRQGAVPKCLLLLGVISWDDDRHPWASAMYTWAIRIPILAEAANFVRHLVFHEWSSGRSGHFLSSILLAMGTVMGLAAFAFSRRAEELKDTFEILHSVAVERGFEMWYSRHMRMPAVLYSVLWLLCAGASLWDNLDDLHHGCIVAIFSGVILALSYVMACICRSLSKSIDSFCCEAIGPVPLSDITHVWNLTQAVVRKASGAIEQCLIIYCVVVAVVMPLILVSLLDFASAGEFKKLALQTCLPPLFVACGVLYVVVMAATISEKCARVPALVNAVEYGFGTDIDREHVVTYIQSSAAGFYMFGMRVTMATVLKFAYGWGVIGLSLGSQIIATGRVQLKP